MKKLFTTALTLGIFTIAAHAQTEPQKATPPLPPNAKEYTKEEKAAMKAKKEEDLAASFKQANLTDDQIKQAREVLKEAESKSNELKKNPALSDEEKASKKEEINTAKNNRLKEIMGDKFKEWQAIRKKQKEEAAKNNPPAGN